MSDYVDVIDYAVDELLVLASDAKAKVRNRGTCVYPADHPKVKDNKDHYPINSEDQARTALRYANKEKGEAPPWFSGTVKEFLNGIVRKVRKEYPGIQITEKSKKPGKN